MTRDYLIHVDEEKLKKVEQGKRNRRMGADFELRTRKNLEENGFIVAKWTNNIKDNDCVPAKPSKFRLSGTGFPDFIIYVRDELGTYTIDFVECKTNGYLDKIERSKAQWYLKRGYCKNFYVAYKEIINGRVVINYKKIKEE